MFGEEMITAGIDVGGVKKGFHAVGLRRREVLGSYSSRDAREIVEWCVQQMRAEVVGVDAPCFWRIGDAQRAAELALARERISCFWTPTLEAAQAHPKNHYGWMMNGHLVFAALRKTHPLVTELNGTQPPQTPCCFETFPHAVMWALTNGKASAKNKQQERRQKLAEWGVDSARLTNIDLIDAALCALTAQLILRPGGCRAFGSSETGLILVPNG